ncbi:hypothetical protein PCANC_03535 [Puccinia coronata f. sp. avenae]|uniref:Uncharacterized protein n=1 Tax=Puccinia coronata f. sp. avenae TaxID=200324 RepID=A0A2N5SGD1_9BASI|nr:hypothetical protein PCANC_16891 [Puccinia coronata f. sp. avenae]PLW47084.1 hypothetical protein PCASD_03904 [Puccinia coronata f. sp. avenae]PLW55592.1 hypothetical protein PCANC_03535 [Puccinia coronata f. sp. avenae]
MLHLIRTLFSLALVLAFTVVAHPIQGGVVQSELKALEKRFRSMRPEASAPRPWVKTARSLLQSTEATTQLHEKRSNQLISTGVSKIRRRPEAAIIASHHTTGLSNPRPWVQKADVVSSKK